MPKDKSGRDEEEVEDSEGEALVQGFGIRKGRGVRIYWSILP